MLINKVGKARTGYSPTSNPFKNVTRGTDHYMSAKIRAIRKVRAVPAFSYLQRAGLDKVSYIHIHPPTFCTFK